MMYNVPKKVQHPVVRTILHVGQPAEVCIVTLWVSCGYTDALQKSKHFHKIHQWRKNMSVTLLVSVQNNQHTQEQANVFSFFRCRYVFLFSLELLPLCLCLSFLLSYDYVPKSRWCKADYDHNMSIYTFCFLFKTFLQDLFRQSSWRTCQHQLTKHSLINCMRVIRRKRTEQACDCEEQRKHKFKQHGIKTVANRDIRHGGWNTGVEKIMMAKIVHTDYKKSQIILSKFQSAHVQLVTTEFFHNTLTIGRVSIFWISLKVSICMWGRSQFLH